MTVQQRTQMNILGHVLCITKGGEVSAIDSNFLGSNSCFGHLYILGQIIFYLLTCCIVSSMEWHKWKQLQGMGSYTLAQRGAILGTRLLATTLQKCPCKAGEEAQLVKCLCFKHEYMGSIYNPRAKARHDCRVLITPALKKLGHVSCWAG